MYEQYMGVIKALGFQFTPAEWGLCNGQYLSIGQFSALFSLLGCRFGGDCRTDFTLPDLRGRVPMGWGQSPGLSPWVMGAKPGWHHEVLSLSKMPDHTHGFTYTGSGGASVNVSVSASAGQDATPADGDYLAVPASGLGSPLGNAYTAPAEVTTKATIGGVNAAISGFNTNALTIQDTPQATQAVSIQQPTQAVHYSMCLEGLYPSRS
ncbi:phage tail protein [Kordiimonas lipolytica]|uniref:Phage tail protein n=1 Tax=Kordiimonas lipolytica TaxID=1662421 RepID=A0ABV8UBR1_9PROT|nr:tail fiber protein [Kordiimonas lipolytica]